MNVEESRSEQAEELLERLWILTQEHDVPGVEAPGLDERAVNSLVAERAISVNDDLVTLTPSGREEACSVVRRHRLAERLLVDVLGAKTELIHDKACKFEHILDRGLDDRICALLGHPRICPHGSPIPPGDCCRRNIEQTDRIVSALSRLKKNQGGKVAYIGAEEQDVLQKLMSMGVLPGTKIELIQQFPSYVFQSGNSQFAVDRQIADSIYVRIDL
ncbi:MAG: hypothetical protein CMN78_02075 [Spirochaetales bacterium]|nr:hypothetical protein [Spirochaetales bacterium]